MVFAHVSIAQNGDAAIDPFTGTVLPLLPSEHLIPTADGKCNLLVGEDQTAPKLTYSWLGACRFGLVYGKGYTVDEKRNYYFNTFYYGTRPSLVRPHFQGWARTYQTDLTLRGQFEQVFLKTGDAFVPALYSSVGPEAVEYRVYDRDRMTSQFFTTGAVACPVKEWSNPSSYFPDVKPFNGAQAFAKLVKKMCGYRDAKQGTPQMYGIVSAFRAANVLYIIDRSQNYQRVNGQWISNTSIESVRLCKREREADRIDCTAAITEAIAPYVDRINAVIEADKTAEKRAIEEISARFAPLEAEARRKIAAKFVKVTAP